jgi:hypothetical protein
LIPKKIAVSHSIIEIATDPRSIFSASKQENEVLFGRYDSHESKITIDGSGHPSVQRETLLHEILHAIIGHTNLSSEGGPLSGDAEEAVIRAISPMLLDTLRRNPKLASYLTAP